MTNFSKSWCRKCICAGNFLEFINCASGWTELGMCGWRCHREKEKAGDLHFSFPPSPLPILPFPVYPLYGSTKKTFTGKRLKKGNEIKFIFCRNIFLSGSMPPNSHSIFEEGAVFKSFKIVNGGVFQEEGKVVTLNWFFHTSTIFLLTRNHWCFLMCAQYVWLKLLVLPTQFANCRRIFWS